jgi:hypothetical protein
MAGFVVVNFDVASAKVCVIGYAGLRIKRRACAECRIGRVTVFIHHIAAVIEDMDHLPVGCGFLQPVPSAV